MSRFEIFTFLEVFIKNSQDILVFVIYACIDIVNVNLDDRNSLKRLYYAQRLYVDTALPRTNRLKFCQLFVNCSVIYSGDALGRLRKFG